MNSLIVLRHVGLPVRQSIILRSYHSATWLTYAFEFQRVCLQMPSPVAGNDVETPEGNVVKFDGIDSDRLVFNGLHPQKMRCFRVASALLLC